MNNLSKKLSMLCIGFLCIVLLGGTCSCSLVQQDFKQEDQKPTGQPELSQSDQTQKQSAKEADEQQEKGLDQNFNGVTDEDGLYDSMSAVIKLDSYLEKKLQVFAQMSWVICDQGYALIKIPCDKHFRSDEFLRLVCNEFDWNDIFITTGTIAETRDWHVRHDRSFNFDVLSKNEYVYFQSNRQFIDVDNWGDFENQKVSERTIVPRSFYIHTVRFNEDTNTGYISIFDTGVAFDPNPKWDSNEAIKHGNITADDFNPEIGFLFH